MKHQDREKNREHLTRIHLDHPALSCSERSRKDNGMLNMEIRSTEMEQLLSRPNFPKESLKQKIVETNRRQIK